MFTSWVGSDNSYDFSSSHIKCQALNQGRAILSIYLPGPGKTSFFGEVIENQKN